MISKFLFFSCCLVALNAAAQSKFNQSDTMAFNTALVGTYLYEKPSLDAPTLVLVDYGEAVRFIQPNVPVPTQLHKGIQSHWHKVKVLDNEGYILDTDLSSINIKDGTLLRRSEYKWYFRQSHEVDTSMYFQVNCTTGKREEKGGCYGQYLLTKDSLEILTYRDNGQDIYEMSLANFSIEEFFAACRATESHIAWADLRDASGTRYVKEPATKNSEEKGYTFIYQRDSVSQYITHLAIIPYPETYKAGHFELRIKYIRPNCIKILLKTEPVERLAEPVKMKKS